MPLQSQVYSTPGTYTFTPAAGVTAVWAQILGGGQGGSGTSSFGQFGNAGGGGGGGEFVENRMIPTPGPITVVVGAKGTGGVSSGFGAGATLSSASVYRAQPGLPVANQTGSNPNGTGGGGVLGGQETTTTGQDGFLGAREVARVTGAPGGGRGGRRTTGTAGNGGGAPGSATTALAGDGPSGATKSNGGGGASSVYGPGGNGGTDPTHPAGFTTLNPGAGGGGADGNDGVSGGDGGPGRVVLWWIG